MPHQETFRPTWLPLLAATEPEFADDPAALGRAIRRWASLAAATHRAEALNAADPTMTSARTAVEATR